MQLDFKILIISATYLNGIPMAYRLRNTKRTFGSVNGQYPAPNERFGIMVGDEAIYAELYTKQMNDNEKKLFGELKDYLTTYCRDNDMELCIWDEAIEKAK